MKKKIISILLLACAALFTFAACGKSSNPPTDSSGLGGASDSIVEAIDYAGQVTLDMDSAETIKKVVTLKTHVDGDTSHFNVPKGDDVPEDVHRAGFLKARYLGVNTPESTGTIEEWGKKASKFTKEKLTTAKSIVIETDNSNPTWDHDANGRYLLWVWYQPADGGAYRNLNVELLQNGLALGSKTSDIRYGEACGNALRQAQTLKLHVYSNEKDPDYYYGEAFEIDLKELRTNIENYNGKRVAFEATAAVYSDWSVYLEDFDEETGRYYGIPAFYGYHANYHTILKPGNRVRVVGEVSYYEAGKSYQLTDLRYDRMDPTNPDNIQKLEDGHSAAYTKMTVAEFNAMVTVNDKEFKSAYLALGTSISMDNLTVIDTYTTNNGGDNDGAITLTCKDVEGNIITVRTAKLFDENKNLIKDTLFYTDTDKSGYCDEGEGKTISVKGIVDVYDEEYQIKVFLIGNIQIQE